MIQEFKEFNEDVKVYWKLGNNRYLIELNNGEFGFWKYNQKKKTLRRENDN